MKTPKFAVVILIGTWTTLSLLYFHSNEYPKGSLIQADFYNYTGKVRGQVKIYKSIDKVCNMEDAVHYSQEFLNSLDPAGLPPHELKLKIGTPITLLRNLSPPYLCNGTRILIKDLKNNLIVATILIGPGAGQLAHIPRIPMIPYVVQAAPISHKNIFCTDYKQVPMTNIFFGNEDFLINTSGCFIPNYAKTMNFIEAWKSKRNCGQRVIFMTKKSPDKLEVEIDMEKMKKFYNFEPSKCCYQFASRSEEAGKEDTQLKYTECGWLDDKKINMIPFTSENIKLTCGDNNYEDHFVVLKEKETEKTVPEEESSESYNVLVIGMDTMSRARLHNTMPNTVKYLQSNGWLDYKGFQKVGFNTFPNVMALLTGKKMSTIYKECKGMEACKHLLLWPKFKHSGYVTAYGEDDLDLPDTFASHKGFPIPPTDHYMRPFFLLGEKVIGNSVCCGKVPSGIHVLNYAADFAKTYKNRKMLGWFWINSFAHNIGNLPTLFDSETLQFFENLNKIDVLKNTFVVFLSDHGVRFGTSRFSMESYYEERLPLLYIWVPLQFRVEHPLIYHNLLTNQNRLTTPYDVHLTLQDILKISNHTVEIEKSEACPQCSSLFLEKSPNRTCADAGVDEKWCSCHSMDEPSDYTESQKSVNTALSTVQNLAKLVITKPCTVCAPLKLKTLIRNHTYQSGDFNYYVIAFTTTPGNYSYEATVRTDGKEFETIGPTHAIVPFHSNGNCVINMYDKSYCFCETTTCNKNDTNK